MSKNIYRTGKCDYCSEANRITRPTPFMADGAAMMCKDCWDMTEEEYAASEGACIGKFEGGPGYEETLELSKKESLNNIPEEEIDRQGEDKGSIRCDECGYDSGYTSFSKAVYKVNMQGGYFMYDGQGGSDTKCPVCSGDHLTFDD